MEDAEQAAGAVAAALFCAERDAPASEAQGTDEGGGGSPDLGVRFEAEADARAWVSGRCSKAGKGPTLALPEAGDAWR